MIGYLIGCLYLYFKQKSLTYPSADTPIPTDVAILTAKRIGVIPWDHPTPGAASPQGYVRTDFTQPAARGTIVYFHGNGETAWEQPSYVEAWKQHGFRAFLYEYPGYGGRPGHPSETAIVPDARALIRSLDQAGYGPIYVWGISLGTGIASSVCADTTLPVHGLVLCMPWDNIANVALSMYPYVPARQMMSDQYDSLNNLQHFGHPICIVRGDLDPTIPPALTLNLFDHLPEPKKMILMSGYGHGDWPSSPELAWWDDVLNFIAPKVEKQALSSHLSAPAPSP